MAPEIALAAIPDGGTGTAPLNVVDPMCGSGTVLAVAIARGHTAVGVDVDPLAVMMSRLACTVIDTEQLLRSASVVVERARRMSGRAPWRDDAETEAFVDYWFAPPQKLDLISLSSAIGRLRNGDHRLALQLALSRIIITKAPMASLAADTSHSRPHRVRTESNFDVYSGFLKSARQLSRMLSNRVLAGRGSAQLGDARVMSTLADGAADLAVTSPPYLNALDYLRGHKFALVWFGYTIGELREIRGTSIGAERGLDVPCAATVSEIVDGVERHARYPLQLRRPMIERFAHDCFAFAAQLHRVLKPSGRAVLVVGDSTLRGNFISNSSITQQAMEYAGFQLIDLRQRDIPPSSRYMAISSKNSASSITKRMRTEVILTMAR